MIGFYFLYPIFLLLLVMIFQPDVTINAKNGAVEEFGIKHT